MTDRAVAKRIILVLAFVAVGCGHPEQRVVDQYFNALNQGDHQTLSSFAAVKFDKKVKKWEILEGQPAVTGAVPLPDFHKKFMEAEAKVAANKKEAQKYSLDHYDKIDELRTVRKKKGKVPARLAEVAKVWDEFNEKDRKLKKDSAAAKDAYETERRYVTLSVGDRDDLHTIHGELVTKQLDLALTLEGGTVENHRMTLRKYNLSPEDGSRSISRWMVFALEPI